MRTPALVVGSLALMANAMPQPWQWDALAARQDTSPATIPQNDPNPSKRAAEIAARNAGFIYGPSLIGQAAPFPNGTLGNALSKSDMDLWAVDRQDIDDRIEKDVAGVQQALQANGGLTSIETYAHVLYDGQWQNANPRGVSPGILTNYTQDLLFSMERLSQNPYTLVLIKPTDDLPFAVDDDTAKQIASATLDDLQASGSLFFVDFTYQLKLAKTTLAPQRYGAACQAYFYIHPETQDFLPLAIKTNVGSDLIYTPLDTDNDWLLAKLMFNANDMFHSQMLHLVISHDVSEATHQAALHTLSPNHPIMVVLDRLMLQGYSSRIVGEELCFNEGGHWDQLMHINNTGCRQFVTDQWPVGGRFQAGYLHTDLQARGLLDENNEFPFKNFPFYEDASVIQSSYKDFFTSFVDSYYAGEDDLSQDFEVQNWVTEATAHADVQDFPSGPINKQTLVDILTHFGFIVSVSHHALNGGDPVGCKATLPFHASAIFAPIPEDKGVTDLLPFLPTAPQAVHYIGFIASFNRPFYETSGRVLEDAFLDDSLMGRLNDDTKAAGKTFIADMTDLSNSIRARTFDENGLSQGMPYIYRTIDPGYIPFFCSV